MTRKKLLYIGACITLAVLLVGVALYFIPRTTDVVIDKCSQFFPDGKTSVAIDAKIHLRRYDYLFRPSEYEMVEFNAASHIPFTITLPENCRAVSQNEDPSFVIVQGYYRNKSLGKNYDCYFAISMENGYFIAKFPNDIYTFVGSAGTNYHPKDVLKYFSAFIDNSYEPSLSTKPAINSNGTEATLKIRNWAVVDADGEIIEKPDMKLDLRIQDYLSSNPEWEVLSFDQPQENRYKYTLPSSNPVKNVYSYVIIEGAYRDTILNKLYTNYYALSIKDGLFIAKHLDTEYYLIGSTDANYSPKDILSHFSAFIDIGCQLPR